MHKFSWSVQNAKEKEEKPEEYKTQFEGTYFRDAWVDSTPGGVSTAKNCEFLLRDYWGITDRWKQLIPVKYTLALSALAVCVSWNPGF